MLLPYAYQENDFYSEWNDWINSEYLTEKAEILNQLDIKKRKMSKLKGTPAHLEMFMALIILNEIHFMNVMTLASSLFFY